MSLRASGAITPGMVVSAAVATDACVSPAGACVGETYVVAPGDLLILEDLAGCISRCAGISLDDLLAANPEIADPNRVVRGEVIRIPR